MILYVAILLRFVSVSLFLHFDVQAANYQEVTQDQTSARANTLLDDADDIQRQLENEARDRLKIGRPKTIWIFHMPAQILGLNKTNQARISRELAYQRNVTKGYIVKERKREIAASIPIRTWNYEDQHTWSKVYRDCGGRSQSPVDLPYHGLIMVKTGRKLVFKNYDVAPQTMTLINDGARVVITGRWKYDERPYIQGGAAHSRRYIFHSITLHWPSEHTVAGLQYPMESQALHLSAEYESMEHAISSSINDPQAFLAVSTLYKYSNQTDRGLNDMMRAAVSATNPGPLDPKPLKHFFPPFKEYACYQGSLTSPPCTEAVLWLVRGKALSVTRETVEGAHRLLRPAIPGEAAMIFRRNIQPMNDRKTYYFKS